MGKSSVTTQLALSLSLQGHAVGVLDIDLTGPSMPRFLGIEAAKITQAPGGWLPVTVHEQQTLAPSAPATYPLPETPADTESNDPAGINCVPDKPASVGPLYAISLGLLLQSRSASIVWRGPKKTAMVRQFLSDVLWPQLDYLLIDTPPGTSDEHISVVETLLRRIADSAAARTIPPNLAGAVIVTTPQAVAISDVRKEINFCAKTGVKIVGVVENMSGYVCPCCGEPTNIFAKGGGEAMARELGSPFLGAVPVDGLWGQLVEEGIRPVYGREVPDLATNSGKENEDSDDDDSLNEVRSVEITEREREPGLLVDKYRSCSLCPLFAGIADQVSHIVAASTPSG